MIKIRQWQRWQKYCLNNEFDFFFDLYRIVPTHYIICPGVEFLRTISKFRK